VRVLFWGTPSFSEPPLRALLGEGFEVVGVVTQPDKPVGLVYWAVAHAGDTVVRERIFPGDRQQIQTLASYAALSLVRDVFVRGKRVVIPQPPFRHDQ